MTDPARLMRVALGQAPADLLVTGAQVVNVYTGELVRWDVAVAGERVAAVGRDLSGLAGSETERIEARGQVLVPGFIDGHLDILVTIPELFREAIPRGLTPPISWSSARRPGRSARRRAGSSTWAAGWRW